LKGSLTEIDESIFDGNTGITHLRVPDNCAGFKVSLLDKFQNLEEFEIVVSGNTPVVSGQNGQKGIVYNGDKTELLYVSASAFDEEHGSLVLPASLKKIDDRVFYNNTYLTSISFANITGDLEIGAYAFYGCTGLTGLSLPAGLTKLGEFAFAGCSNLVTLTFADGCNLSALPSGVFNNCSSLTAIRIPANVTEMPGYTATYTNGGEIYSLFGIFHGCSSLGAVTFETGSKCTKFGDYAFETNAGSVWTGTIQPSGKVSLNVLTTIEIPSSVTSIGAYAFIGAKISSITLPSSLTEIPEGLFYGCAELLSDGLTNKMTTIGDYAYYGCAGIGDEVIIPSSVTAIGKNAFEGCSSIEKLTVPNSVLEFGDSTFKDCSGLSELNFETLLLSLPDYMFRGCSSLGSFPLPASVRTFGYGFLQECGNLGSLTIDVSKMAEIPSYFVKDCESLSTLTFDNFESSVLSTIGKEAFYNTGLVSVELPDSVSTIGAYAFYGCSELTTLSGLDNVTTLEAISNNGGLVSYAFAYTKLSSITLSTELTALPAYLFYGSSQLSSISGIENVTSFGAY
ncbi:MAG: leucine-rich repeat domain-containing protein, partial [Clostridiales bacterium]|nr:leucine-rich repeat domain-containing protein [Clostridiales bacterium]